MSALPAAPPLASVEGGAEGKGGHQDKGARQAATASDLREPPDHPTPILVGVETSRPHIERVGALGKIMVLLPPP